MGQPSQPLRTEYRQLFDTLEIRAERAKAVDKLCAQALALVPRYTPIRGQAWTVLSLRQTRCRRNGRGSTISKGHSTNALPRLRNLKTGDSYRSMFTKSGRGGAECMENGRK